MIDEIREKIDLNKKDIESYKEYVKAFVDLEKAKELFKDNSDYKYLVGEKKEEIKEEDEFF